MKIVTRSNSSSNILHIALLGNNILYRAFSPIFYSWTYWKLVREYWGFKFQWTQLVKPFFINIRQSFCFWFLFLELYETWECYCYEHRFFWNILSNVQTALKSSETINKIIYGLYANSETFSMVPNKIGVLLKKQKVGSETELMKWKDRVASKKLTVKESLFKYLLSICCLHEATQ